MIAATCVNKFRPQLFHRQILCSVFETTFDRRDVAALHSSCGCINRLTRSGDTLQTLGNATLWQGYTSCVQHQRETCAASTVIHIRRAPAYRNAKQSAVKRCDCMSLTWCHLCCQQTNPVSSETSNGCDLGRWSHTSAAPTTVITNQWRVWHEHRGTVFLHEEEQHQICARHIRKKRTASSPLAGLLKRDP